MLAGEYQLYGNVQSLDKVQLAQAKRDTLLLSFKDAKVMCSHFIRLEGSLDNIALNRSVVTG